MTQRWPWVLIKAAHTNGALPPGTHIGAVWTVDTLVDPYHTGPIVLAYGVAIEGAGAELEHLWALVQHVRAYGAVHGARWTEITFTPYRNGWKVQIEGLSPDALAPPPWFGAAAADNERGGS